MLATMISRVLETCFLGCIRTIFMFAKVLLLVRRALAVKDVRQLICAQVQPSRRMVLESNGNRLESIGVAAVDTLEAG